MDLITYKFFLKSLIAAFFASIACGIIGTYIVSRRIVFISGGISHASFGGIGMGYYLGIDPVIGAAVFGVMAAIVVQFMSEHSDIRQDSLIGILWSFGMAIGIIFIYITPGYAPDLMSYLFGDILTVTYLDVLALFAIVILSIFTFTFWYRKILYISFDEEFMKSRGINTRIVNYILICLVALVIVTCIRVVGIILVISLLTVPQAIAELFTDNYSRMIVMSSVFGFSAIVIGLVVSSLLGIPSGATIIFSLVFLFMILKGMQSIRIRLRLKSNLRNTKF
ncbi:metal ABC transporter permease [bacterium]|nr:metal ABC transporter permease [bacterium]